MRASVFFRPLPSVLLALIVLAGSSPAAAQRIIATILVGRNPVPVAVNTVTNKVYVVNRRTDICCKGSVSVIDGITLSVTTVPTGITPSALAVNQESNKIYVINTYGDNQTNGTVTVIDGVTLSVVSVSVGFRPYAVAINQQTNKIYVVNSCGNDPNCLSNATVTVIDGLTLSTLTLPVGFDSAQLLPAIAVDQQTNRIYVVNTCGNDSSCNSRGTVTTIDGATLSTHTILAGFSPAFAAVDPVTNKIYVVNRCGNDVTCNSNSTVTVIDGVTLSTTNIDVGFSSANVAVNSATNKIYVTNECGSDRSCSRGTVTVMDGTTLSTIAVTVDVGPARLAINQVANKVYVVNVYGGYPNRGPANGTVTVVDGTTLSTTALGVGVLPRWAAVNEVTNRIYVANECGNDLNCQNPGTVSVIDGTPPAAWQFVPTTPCRVVDTRPSYGGSGPIPGGTAESFPLPQLGTCNIPATAAAYSLNVTAIPEGSLAYLTIWPTGQPQPTASLMNSLDGRIKANAAIVAAGTSQAVSVYVTNTTNIILDINGYFVPLPNPDALAFYPLTPCRVADTRDMSKPLGLGPPSLSARVPRDFPILRSTCNIPSTAQAYSMNFTVVPKPATAFLTVWPTGETRPNVSTLNDQTGTIVANAGIVPIGTGGDIDAYSDGNTDLIIDINGYFAAPGQGGLSLYSPLVCRVLDTRPQYGGNGAFNGILTPPVNVVGSGCSVSSLAQGFVFNATVVPSGGLSYLTLWPDGESQPVVSTLNAIDGAITSNMAIVPNVNGSTDAYAFGITQLILDISGYFAP